MAAPPPPPLPPPHPAVLMEEIVEEFLLRLPPEDPALLAHTALVSRQWYRVVTGPSFRRRFRELHRSKPLLGYILNFADSIRFFPMLSFRPPHARHRRRRVRAVSSTHGRVLLHRLSARDLRPPRFPGDNVDVLLSVWHPITDVQQDLPVVQVRPTRYPNWANWDAAVVCAVGDDCDHLHCHFKVVFVGQRDERTFSCVYSSEAGSWSDPVFAAEESENGLVAENCILIGQCLYTTCVATDEIFKYDLQTHQMCNVSTTPAPARFGRLIAAEDGRLGFANASNSTLRLWVRENGRWEESRVIDLHMLLPCEAIRDTHWVANFAETGAGVIFLWTRVGNFTIDLKSGSCKKVSGLSGRILPYVSFCTPAPGAGVAMSSDVVPIADIAVSTVEGPGTGAAVSADERPGAGSMCQVPKKLNLQVQGPLNQEGNE